MKVGWAALERIINDFKVTVDIDAPRELRELMEIPHMTRKIAKALEESGVSTAEGLAESDAAVLSQKLLLSMGFQIQVQYSVQRYGSRHLLVCSFSVFFDLLVRNCNKLHSNLSDRRSCCSPNTSLFYVETYVMLLLH